MSKLLKNLLIVLGISLVLLFGYLLFLGGDSSTALTGGGEPFSAAAELETQQLLVTLQELKSYNVDDSLFTDPLFVSLFDMRTNLGTEASGRANPFAPL